MHPKLFEAALEESIRFGPAARLVLTFPGNEEALHIHPLAYTQVEDTGFRVEIRTSDVTEADLVDDVIFVDSGVIETVELQVKQAGVAWKDEPYESYGDEDIPE